MYRKLGLLIASAVLVSAQAHAQTTDEAKTSQFAFCAAIGAAGKTATGNPDAQKYFGAIYTKYLWSAFVFSKPEDVRREFAAAVERQSTLYKESASADDFSAKVGVAFKNCEAILTEDADRINASKTPIGADENATLKAEPGSTTPLDVMAVLGKPFHQDYNPDGRFVYNYPTKTGSDVYLFDRQQKLIRVRSYCDALKGKCS